MITIFRTRIIQPFGFGTFYNKNRKVIGRAIRTGHYTVLFCKRSECKHLKTLLLE